MKKIKTKIRNRIEKIRNRIKQIPNRIKQIPNKKIKVQTLVSTAMYAGELRFGKIHSNPTDTDFQFNSNSQIERVNLNTLLDLLEEENQMDEKLTNKSSMIADLNESDQSLIINTRSGKISMPERGGSDKQPGKFGPGSKARGAANRDFARKQLGKTSISAKAKSKSSQSSVFVDGLIVNTQFLARPGAGGNQPQPARDVFNQGCAGGPKSVTVLKQSQSAEEEVVREITAHDGVTGTFTDKSLDHLTTKHGHSLNIDDPLPPDPNQKSSPYKDAQIRTRVNAKTKKQFGDKVEEIIQDPTSKPYPDVSIRGIKGHGYWTEEYGGENGFFVGIHTEGKFEGQIKKAQPLGARQRKILEEENRVD